MTEGHDPKLSIEEQATLWVLESKDDPVRRAAAMRWCDEAPEHRIAFDEAEAKMIRLDAAGESLRSGEPEVQSSPSRQGLWKLAIAASVIGLLVISLLGFKKEAGQPQGQREVAVRGGRV